MKIRICINLLLIIVSFNARSQFESNLPIFEITTEGIIVDNPKIKGSLKVYDKIGDINKLTDMPVSQHTIGIETRGSTSQILSPKKPFGFETRNEKGENLDVSILGLPEDNDWILLAPYSDKTLLRDNLSYVLARMQNRYASRTKFVEVVVNGNYVGVYVFAEKIKKGKNRVAISTMKTTDITGDELTGGYILKIDKTTGTASSSFSSNYVSNNTNGAKTLFLIDYPKIEDIATEQRSYIRDFVRNFEDRLQSTDFKDDEKGFKKVIDLDSFVDYFLLTELTRNVDGYRLSTYFYKDKNSKNPKMTMGPAWDYNIAFGNADYCDGWKTSGWAYQFDTVCPNDYYTIPFWWKKIVLDPAFQLKAKARWKELRNTVYSTSNILNYVDSTSKVLDDAQKRNFVAWPIIGKYIWPNKFIGTSAQDEIGYLKKWVTDRLAWMDNSELLNPNILNEESALAETKKIQIYPNPFVESATLAFKLNNISQVKITIYDQSGRQKCVLLNEKLNKGLYELPIHKNDLPKGIYFITLINSEKAMMTQKVVIN